jgi:hypothetical protein
MDFGGVQVKRIHVSQCKLVCQEIMAMAKAGPQTILWVEKSLYYLLTLGNCLQAYGPKILLCIWEGLLLLSGSTAATYIFTAPICTTTLISLKP